MKGYFRMTIVIALVLLVVGIGPVNVPLPARAGDSIPSGVETAYPLDKWKTSYIYTDDSAGSNVSIAYDPDHGYAPWIAFYNDSTKRLIVAHFVGSTGGDCGPGNTWICETVEGPSEGNGLYASIDIYPDTNPNPFLSTWKVGVSYHDETYNVLKYAQYDCENFPQFDCGWHHIYAVDYPIDFQDDMIGHNTSLKFSPSGVPNIAYYAYYSGFPFGTARLKRAFLADDNAVSPCQSPSIWRCDWIDQSFVSLGYYPSLDFDYNGGIHIAWNQYYIHNSQPYTRLELAWYAGPGSCGQGDTWACDTIDQTNGVNTGLFPSLHSPKNSEDKERIAYYDATNGKLKYVTSGWAGGGGNCGPGDNWLCLAIDDIGIDRDWVSISLDVDSHNTPMIAYSDAHEELAPLGLKIAEPAYLQPYANCNGEMLYDWFCGDLDNGDANTDEAEYLSLSIKPDGLAMVAYSELDKYEFPNDFDLKFTYQTNWIFLPLLAK